MHSKTYYAKPRGITLIDSTQIRDQIVLEMIRWGRLVLVIRGQESQNYFKEDYQA
jgi:hypothetical protein